MSKEENSGSTDPTNSEDSGNVSDEQPRDPETGQFITEEKAQELESEEGSEPESKEAEDSKESDEGKV